MLCSNWLDRLRSSKGFPYNESDSSCPHPQTELRDNNDNSNNSTGSESSSDPTRSATDPVQIPAAPELCNVVSNVLSELFCMGEESTNFPKLRPSRKQTNPRFCASSEIHNARAAESGDDNSRVEKIKDSSKVKLLEQGNENLKLGEEEEDKTHGNLMGFSRTEVMVIDTSCAPWKFEKLLFRKKNVWKVRDKKSKTMNVGKKKRKADVTDGDVGGEKKQKVDKLRLKDKLERTSDSVGQASKKRQGDLKLKKASSSVILIKSIPTSKKNGTGIAKNSLKPSQ